MKYHTSRQHNHPCTTTFMATDCSRRRLCDTERSVIQPFVEKNTDPLEVMDLAHAELGKVLLYSDIRNMRTKVYERKIYVCVNCPGIGNLNDLIRRSSTIGKVEVLRDSGGNVSKIIFARNDMVSLYGKFPEVVGIDSTYKTNKMGGRTVLFALTQTEKRTDIKHILQSFKNIIGDTSKTTTFTVGCALGQLRALNEAFPGASIILCLFHVCQSFRKKFSNPLVKKWLYRMAHTRSYATFWHCVRIIDLIDRAGGTYIRSYWLRSRSYWAASHNRFTLSMGNNTNNRVENSHRQLKRYLKKNDSIEMTVWKIWRWIDHDTQRKHMQDILCNSERWTRSYHVFHELPRVVRQVPGASVEFHNKYQRLRARIAHLNKIDPTRAIQAIDGSQRIVDSLFHEATNSVVRLSHAPTQRRLRLNVPSLMQSKTFSSNFFLYVFFLICNTFQINYFVT
ncbi:hypothetical protein MN116_000033 [Schistosoma mekongi]|uniref:ZSWIM1/3 RNaseH-like domain-containing protein n=1 Tax=Schistosoma mekongi TaxID=38744 RepID=A0AAE1ZIL1_SCHME|nr:hypothetical protein MN116_000033 [Schistosoma mekongi]